MTGWSNFCTLVGHFSKLFELAGLSRLETPISQKHSVSPPKKRSSLGIGLRNTYFCSKNIAFSKKKKAFTLESVSTLDSVPSARHALLYKVAAACDRQDLNCAKLFRGPVVGPF